MKYGWILNGLDTERQDYPINQAFQHMRFATPQRGMQAITKWRLVVTRSLELSTEILEATHFS